MKGSSASRVECVTTSGLYRPTHLCVAHFELHKKVWQFFFFFCDVVRLGVGGSMFQEVGDFVQGFREGRGDVSSGLSQPGGKSC